MSNDETKFYDFSLPVFQQGNDFDFYRAGTATPKEAFAAQAEAYEEAARLCRLMAGVAAEDPTLSAMGCTHMITVESAYHARMAALVRDGVLVEVPEYLEEDDAPITERSIPDDEDSDPPCACGGVCGEDSTETV